MSNISDNERILFYYRKRVMIISEEMLKTGYAVIAGHKISLTKFVDTMFDKLPEQILNITDPEFDENVPYICMHKTNPLIKERFKEDEQ